MAEELKPSDQSKNKFLDLAKKTGEKFKGISAKAGQFRIAGISLFFAALWRNIKSFRPDLKGINMSGIKSFVKRRDFLRIVLICGAVVWLMGTIIAGITRVRENEVGIKLNNLNGNLAVKDKVGIYFYNPYFSNFYTLTKTVQSLDMSFTSERAKSPDEIRIKTRDGSNVSLNVTINYKLIPEKGDVVIRLSGKGQAFSEKWIRTYSRAIAINRFGELSTEEFYDTVLRNEKARLARNDLNTLLNPFGMEIVSVIPRDFHFYKEYEEVIKARKVADQSVEEQKAKAASALEEQKKWITVEKAKAAVEIAKAFGESQRIIVESSGQAQKIRIGAESYAYQREVNAEAELFSAQKESEGILAMGQAEARGYERLRQAMQGSGGQNLISLEYARKLKEIEFTGTPITHEGHVPQLNLKGSTSANDMITQKD